MQEKGKGQNWRCKKEGKTKMESEQNYSVGQRDNR